MRRLALPLVCAVVIAIACTEIAIAALRLTPFWAFACGFAFGMVAVVAAVEWTLRGDR